MPKESFPTSRSRHPTGPTVSLLNLDCLEQDGGGFALLLCDLLSVFLQPMFVLSSAWCGPWRLNYFSCRLAALRGSLTIFGH